MVRRELPEAELEPTAAHVPIRYAEQFVREARTILIRGRWTMHHHAL